LTPGKKPKAKLTRANAGAESGAPAEQSGGRAAQSVGRGEQSSVRGQLSNARGEQSGARRERSRGASRVRARERGGSVKRWILPAVAVAVVALLVFSVVDRSNRAAPELWDYEIVNEYPHDPGAFTQGLVFVDSTLYESTGRYGESTLRRVRLETGEVLQRRALDSMYFAEGLTEVGGRLIQLTWQTQVGFVYDRATLDSLAQFQYAGEGWGLTYDGSKLILSDGSATLRFLDPTTFRQIGQLEVHDENGPLPSLNELEMMGGDLLANVWQTDRIVVIDLESGRVKARVDLTGLLRLSDRVDATDVLNGIAYDARGDRLFVTGKLWPKLFEIRLKPAG
jgi:glutaminyl-peptide cyclotransferase